MYDLDRKLNKTCTYISAVLSIIIGLTSLIILCVVVLKRRRREIFVVGIPSCFFLNGIAASFLCIVIIKSFHNTSSEYLEKFSNELIWCFVIINFTFPIAQWLFGIQYLKTSLLLPKLLINGKASALIAKIR